MIGGKRQKRRLRRESMSRMEIKVSWQRVLNTNSWTWRQTQYVRMLDAYV